MRERLINIVNALVKVETKGDSTLIMADCIRELMQMINDEASNAQSQSEEEASNAQSQSEAE